MRRTTVLFALAALVANSHGGPSVAEAHEQSFEIGGNAITLSTQKGPAKQTFVFRSTNQAKIVPVHDPAVEGTALLVRGTGENGGRTHLITLDPAAWKGLGKPAGSKGYVYRDKLGAAGGVQSITYKPGKKGGMLAITAKGASWSWSPAGAQDSVWVHFRVGEEWHCAEFGGDVKKNEAGYFKALKAPAPAACPVAVCGNGEVESGEQCDDGDLDDGNACSNACTGSSCGGDVFASTWEAIQTRVFDQGGCANLLCHAGPAAAGGLSLEPSVAHANLVNAAASVGVLDRVEPGDEDLSLLYLKLAAATLAPDGPEIPGSPMPSGGLPAVSADTLAALRLWIRAGAPETGVVDGTAGLLDGCLPPQTPNKMPPLDPPSPGTGVQLYAPPWPLPPNDEDEICYATYYDFNSPGVVPESAQAPCPTYLGGPTQTCFKYHDTLLAQDPQSHHSIIHIYRGTYDWTSSGWGPWTCKGGDLAGMACNPTLAGVSALAGGADCGPRAGCTGKVQSTVACIGYGPPDYGFQNAVAPSFSGSQEPLSSQNLAPGVYSMLPMSGIVVWNSHAFNLTEVPSTMEQYQNLWFAEPQNQLYPLQGIFDDSEIFVQNVPAFQSREYCRTYTAPLNANVFELSSHTHKRGVLFRIWGPPNASCTAGAGCLPNAGAPIYSSTEYNDPVHLNLTPPLVLNSTNANNRRFKFCALYDNGATDPSTVKRRSTSPAPPFAFAPGGPCAVSETRCIGGPQHDQLCNGTNAFCDSNPGAGDGDCDACPLKGGVTTEDEMYILLGSYYIP